MKIALITLHRVFNYGSVLQAYATQKVLNDLGHDVMTVDYIPSRLTNKRLYFDIPDYIKKDAFHKCSYLALKSISVLLKKMTFWRFIDNNIKLTKQRYFSFEELKNNPPLVDAYISGSDQVWNSFYNLGLDHCFFVDFAPSNKKRIAFVSSFGKIELDDEEIGKTKELISKYNAISVREDTALKIMEVLKYPNAVCLIDPTLQIESVHWLELAANRVIKEKYLLLMLLYSEDNGATEYAQKIAKQKGFKVVKLSWEYKKPQGVDILKTHKSPQVFLSLFQHAEFIVTNSFHGLAFSINLNKQFTVIPRNEFNTRIESLLRMTHLENRMIKSETGLDVIDIIINYEPINVILNKERERAKRFLVEALGE